MKTYCYWIRYFIRFHGVRHPVSIGGPEVRAFLEHLAVQRHVAATTQNQALNTIVFLYRHGHVRTELPFLSHGVNHSGLSVATLQMQASGVSSLSPFWHYDLGRNPLVQSVKYRLGCSRVA